MVEHGRCFEVALVVVVGGEMVDAVEAVEEVVVARVRNVRHFEGEEAQRGDAGRDKAPDLHPPFAAAGREIAEAE